MGVVSNSKGGLQGGFWEVGWKLVEAVFLQNEIIMTLLYTNTQLLNIYYEPYQRAIDTRDRICFFASTV